MSDTTKSWQDTAARFERLADAARAAGNHQRAQKLLRVSRLAQLMAARPSAGGDRRQIPLFGWSDDHADPGQ